MEYLKEFFQREIVKKILFFSILMVFFYLTKSIFNLLLLTFLITYLISSLQGSIMKGIRKFYNLKKGTIITISLYTIIFITISLLIYKYLPAVVNQGLSMINEATVYAPGPNSSSFEQSIAQIIKELDVKRFIQTGTEAMFEGAKKVGEWSMNIFLAIILSLFFMLEKEKILSFLKKVESSKISEFYKQIKFFGDHFLTSFGKVMQAQILIAATNTFLSSLGLYIIGLQSTVTPNIMIRNIPVLACMIFILSLIPVAGTVISLVPLSFIAYNTGGIMFVIYVLVMIAVIHAIEAYFLNPKFMSQKTELPVFLTFVILIVSEHFMGIWGLLLGIPIFIFVMDLIEVNINDESEIECSVETKKAYSKKK